MFRTFRLLAAFGMIFSFAISGANIGDGNPFAAQSAQAGLWSKVKKKAKSATKKITNSAKKVGRKAKSIAKDQLKGAKTGLKVTKQFFKDGVKVRCCGYGKIGELPKGTKGYQQRDHRKQAVRDHRRRRN